MAKKDELLTNYAIKSERVHTINQLLKAYTMSEIALDDITNNIVQDKVSKSITKEDIDKLEKSFNSALDSIKKSIEELKHEQSNANVNAVNANGE